MDFSVWVPFFSHLSLSLSLSFPVFACLTAQAKNCVDDIAAAAASVALAAAVAGPAPAAAVAAAVAAAAATTAAVAAAAGC